MAECLCYQKQLAVPRRFSTVICNQKVTYHKNGKYTYLLISSFHPESNHWSQNQHPLPVISPVPSNSVKNGFIGLCISNAFIRAFAFSVN